MIQRFQIEDMIIQDESGVVFRALDTETGKPVAVRRFFPFGADGGGLLADEQTAYTIAVNRLAGLRHPALRSVITGGCDPVDGMPFIATEWIEGESLLPLISKGPLSGEAATELLTNALEVSELLSHVLAEEAVWVETDIQTIVVSQGEGGRGFTFWISPLKWLGSNGEQRGLESMISLTEEIMGWSGRIVNDQAGRGLGGWLKWLRNQHASASLHEAREMLAASLGVEPPAPAASLVAEASRYPHSPRRRPPFKMPVFALLSCLVALSALGGWLLIRQKAAEAAAPHFINPPATHAAEEPQKPRAPRVSPDTERANRLAAELSAQAMAADQAASDVLAKQQAAVDQQNGVFSPEHCELLLHNENQAATVEGTLDRIEFSTTKKTMYLVFSGDSGWNAARGSIVLSKAPADLTEDALRPLIGKKVRLHGKIDAQKTRDHTRPLIILSDRASIQAVE